MKNIMSNLTMDNLEENFKIFNNVIKKVEEGKEVTSQDVKTLMSDQDKNNYETAAYCSALYQMLLLKGVFKPEDLELFNKYKKAYMEQYMESSVKKTVNEIRQLLKSNDEIMNIFKMFDEEEKD